MTSYKLSLFIFRRDLRLKDNTGLIQALRSSEKVIPCFIFDPRQIESHRYQSVPGLQFMLESLADLDKQLKKYQSKLSVFYGNPVEKLRDIITAQKIEAVYVNRDYTPFSRRRDSALEKFCKSNGIDFYACNDLLLIEPEYALKADGAPYTVFTPFFRNASRFSVDQVQALTNKNFYRKQLGDTLKSIVHSLFPGEPVQWAQQGGRDNAIAILKKLASLANYENTRDFPSIQGTTHLSAHNKFGTCSIREVYYAIKKLLDNNHGLLRELYWRDFFTHIGFHFPDVFGHAFHQKYDSIEWDNNRRWFKRWCEGNTGFPIVDAGMRELNDTGYMHNRVRMITASFLVKDLHIDWRWGERYFAQKLIDYDPCVNNGNWQWAASTGCDAQPYFRIFNPWLQQKKFDEECRYIYQWIPELKNSSASEIHQWYKNSRNHQYPDPIVDHSQQATKAKAMFKAVSQA